MLNASALAIITMTVPHTRGEVIRHDGELSKSIAYVAEDRFVSFHLISFASLVTNKGFFAIP